MSLKSHAQLLSLKHRTQKALLSGLSLRANLIQILQNGPKSTVYVANQYEIITLAKDATQ